MVSRDTSLSRIYVGNLPPHVSAKELENEFRKYGTILQCDIKKTVSGSAFAFIEFEDARDAADAIKEKDGCDFEGNRLRVEVPFNARENGRYYGRGRMMGRGQKPRRGKYVVEVSGLPISGSWQDLKDHLREAGECGHADVFKDGTGEVSFFNRSDMLEAIEKFDGSIFRSHEGEKAKISIREKEGGWRYNDDRHGRYSRRNKSFSSRGYSRGGRRSYSRSSSRSRSRSRSGSRSYSSRSRSRSSSTSSSRIYSRSGSKSLSDSRSRSSSSRSRSMDRRRDAYDKKRGYSKSVSYKNKRRTDRSVSKSSSISKCRSRSRSKTNSRSLSSSQERKP